MYTPTQLEAIRIFGKKDLSFGCIMSTTRRIGKIYKNDEGHVFFIAMDDGSLEIYRTQFGFEILGHEPHLEGVFRAAEEKNIEIMFEHWMDMGWKMVIFDGKTITERIIFNPTLPLLEQSEETLTQLISLFK